MICVPSCSYVAEPDVSDNKTDRAECMVVRQGKCMLSRKITNYQWREQSEPNDAQQPDSRTQGFAFGPVRNPKTTPKDERGHYAA